MMIAGSRVKAEKHWNLMVTMIQKRRSKKMRKKKCLLKENHNQTQHSQPNRLEDRVLLHSRRGNLVDLHLERPMSKVRRLKISPSIWLSKLMIARKSTLMKRKMRSTWELLRHRPSKRASSNRCNRRTVVKAQINRKAYNRRNKPMMTMRKMKTAVKRFREHTTQLNMQDFRYQVKSKNFSNTFKDTSRKRLI